MARNLADAMSMEEDGKQLNTPYYWMLVARVGPNLFCVDDASTQYTINSPHENGHHVVFRSDMDARAAKVNPNAELFCSPRVLLKCLAWGQCQERQSHLVFQNIRPVEATPMPFGYLSHSFTLRKHTEIVLDQTRRRMPRFESPTAPLRKEFRQRKECQILQKRAQKYVSTINSLRPLSRQSLGGTTRLTGTQTSRTADYELSSTMLAGGQRLLTSA